MLVVVVIIAVAAEMPNVDFMHNNDRKCKQAPN